MALEINASHPQMTYYLLFSVLIFGVVQMIEAWREKGLPLFFKKVGSLGNLVYIQIFLVCQIMLKKIRGHFGHRVSLFDPLIKSRFNFRKSRTKNQNSALIFTHIYCFVNWNGAKKHRY